MTLLIFLYEVRRSDNVKPPSVIIILRFTATHIYCTVSELLNEMMETMLSEIELRFGA